MAITKLPPAPTPTDTTAEFNAKSFAFVSALDGFVIEANALEALAESAAKSTAVDAETTAVASNAAVLAAKSAVTDAATASKKSARAVTAAKTAAADAATASTDSAAAVSAAKSAVADADTASVAAKAAVSAAQATAADMARTSASSDAAVSAANYKGEWGLMTGALDIPASVSHLNKVWILKHAVSNVSDEQPGVSSQWLSTTDLSTPGPIGTLTPDTGHFKTLRATGSESELSVKLPNIKEVLTIVAVGAAGTIDFDLTRQSVLYSTVNATGHWGLNFRGSESSSLDSMMAVGEVVSATFIVAQGAPAFFNNAVKVDGQHVIPKWIGGTPTAGNVNGLDSYSFALIKLGEAKFTVLASLTQFK